MAGGRSVRAWARASGERGDVGGAGDGERLLDAREQGSMAVGHAVAGGVLGAADLHQQGVERRVTGGELMGQGTAGAVEVAAQALADGGQGARVVEGEARGSLEIRGQIVAGVGIERGEGQRGEREIQCIGRVVVGLQAGEGLAAALFDAAAFIGL
jgi:hypothetical protein